MLLHTALQSSSMPVRLRNLYANQTASTCDWPQEMATSVQHIRGAVQLQRCCKVGSLSSTFKYANAAANMSMNGRKK